MFLYYLSFLKEIGETEFCVSLKTFLIRSWGVSEAKVSPPAAFLNFCSLIIYMYLFTYVSHTCVHMR